jgi:hypothetical protein
MAEDTDKKENTITIDVAEYNALKAQSEKLGKLESTITEKESTIAELKTAMSEAQKNTKGPKREEIEAEIRSELSERITSAEKARDELLGKLKSVTITDKVMNAIGPKIVPSAQKWIRQEIEKECDIDGDFDNGELVIKDEKGNIRWSAKTPDKKMNVEEYQEVLMTRYPEFFQSNARSAETNTGQRLTGVQTQSGTMTLTQFQNLDDKGLRDFASKNPREFDQLLNQLG